MPRCSQSPQRAGPEPEPEGEEEGENKGEVEGENEGEEEAHLLFCLKLLPSLAGRAFPPWLGWAGDLLALGAHVHGRELHPKVLRAEVCCGARGGPRGARHLSP